jgi:hypothetical protein
MCALRGRTKALLFVSGAHQWNTVGDRRHVFDFVHSKNAGVVDLNPDLFPNALRLKNQLEALR